MIFPEEYKNIGFCHSGMRPNTDEKTQVYFLSKYLLEETASGFRLYEVKHTGAGFLRTVESVRLLADENEIAVCGEILNIKNRTLLIEKAAEICEQKNVTTVLFTGIDRHVTFVYEPDLSEISEIQVVDVFPPNPPWLWDCVNRLDKSGIFGDLQIRFSKKLVDLSVYQGENTVYPCRSSELSGLFLDSDKIDGNGFKLVGCDTSKTVFETLYPDSEYEFIEMCPTRSDAAKPDKPFIMRCCKSENSGKIIEVNGNKGVIVHWGAGEYQISENIRKLVSVLRAEKS
ncbi:DUF7714 family protein [Methanolapillus millepedarum]|uniref:Uncharacterized protein n=1 Tax=Methanolapillus millepedarum TaxID=3028296 RepID=A0AA96V275_9EURY|nr:hypothetical protein MsAc7_00420 [Methanosarcinaceae archaeon Ac7]